MAKTAESKRQPGRKPAGLEGVPVSQYPAMTVRLPPDDRQLVDVLSRVKRLPAWRVIVEAVRAYEAALPAADRRVVQHLLSRKP